MSPDCVEQEKNVHCYGLKTKVEAYKCLDKHFREVGVPMKVVTDGGEEMNSKGWDHILSTYHTRDGKTEPGHQQQNFAERNI